MNIVSHFKSLIRSDQVFKHLRQPNVIADVGLEARDAICAEHEPQFQGPEAATQWNAVVSKVNGIMLVL